MFPVVMFFLNHAAHHPFSTLPDMTLSAGGLVRGWKESGKSSDSF